MHPQWSARGAALGTLLLVAACGPATGSTSSSGATVGANASGGASADDGASDTRGTSAEQPACLRSDLPEPFCHDLRQYWEVFGYPVGVVEEINDDIRPLLVSGRDNFGLRLISPLQPADVLADVESPFRLDWDLSGALPLLNADIDGDGTKELILTADRGFGELQVAVLDSRTLQTLAFRDFGGDLDLHALRVAALDVEGDGVVELVIAKLGDSTTTFDVWSIEGGQFVLVGSERTEIRCAAWWFVPGDYNADGQRDLAIVWDIACERFATHDPPEILTVLGGSGADGSLNFIRSPQPRTVFRTTSGDFDGDGASEIVLVHDIQTLSIVGWSSGGFHEAEQIIIDRPPGISGRTWAGRFSHEPFDGIIHGQYATRHPDESHDLYHGALFPELGADSFVSLPHTPFLIGDFNVDGIDDFLVSVEDRYGLYLSKSQWF